MHEGGGGLGFFIGSEERNDQYQDIDFNAVFENHQRYNSWQNAIKADGFEMIPIVVGITATGILTNYNLVTKFGIDVSGGAISNYYVNQKKAELEKSEQNNLLNPGNNTKSKDGEV